MKKIIINICFVLTIFIIYFLQANFFTWFNISGVMPNLFVIYILFIGLFANKKLGIVYGAITGLILDVIVGEIVGINTVLLAIVGYIASVFDKNFAKDNRMIIIVMSIVSTVFFECVSYVVTYMIFDLNVEVVKFIEILLIELLFNTLIIIIIYPIIQKVGYGIENEYKGNKILTRYF